MDLSFYTPSIITIMMVTCCQIETMINTQLHDIRSFKTHNKIKLQKKAG